MALALTVTQATQADIPDLIALYGAVRAEMAADFGELPTFDVTYFTNLLAWGRPIGVARGLAGVIRGACVFRPAGEEGVEMECVATDKTLLLVNRLWVHRQLVLWMANQVPGPTLIFGWVKVGGNLATYLATHSTPILLDGGSACFSVTAAACIASSLLRA